MGIVLKYLEESSEGYATIYDSQIRSIDDYEMDANNDYEDHTSIEESIGKGDKYAEDSPLKKGFHQLRIDESKKKLNKSIFKYFLDGSRHVYKLGDIALNGSIYPIVAGQIVVGCCQRNNRSLSKYSCRRIIVLTVPDVYDADNIGANFFKKRMENINKKLETDEVSHRFGFRIDSVVPYSTAGTKEEGRNKYLHQAIAVVQNEMMDQERTMVENMCSDSVFSDKSFLIKDGTIEYRKDFTNRSDSDTSLEAASFGITFRYVVGVSKLFNAELLNEIEPKIGKMIAELQPFQRTNAYKYKHEGKTYCVWYLRIRDTKNRSNSYADVVKVEFIMIGDEDVAESARVDMISTHLINEAYPVCFGKDSRWANHIYPMFVTESYCKSQYMNDGILTRII